jgi:hypothetical protein
MRTIRRDRSARVHRTRERPGTRGRVAATLGALLGAALLVGCASETELGGGVATGRYAPYAESYGGLGLGYPWYGPSYLPYSSFGFGFFGDDEFRHHHLRHYEEEDRHHHALPPVASVVPAPHTAPVPHAPMPHMAPPAPTPQPNAAVAAHNRQLLHRLGVR